MALWMGGERHAVSRIFTDAVIGPLEAGQTATRELELESAGGQRYRLRRKLPEGEWRVFALIT